MVSSMEKKVVVSYAFFSFTYAIIFPQYLHPVRANHNKTRDQTTNSNRHFSVFILSFCSYCAFNALIKA